MFRLDNLFGRFPIGEFSPLGFHVTPKPDPRPHGAGVLTRSRGDEDPLRPLDRDLGDVDADVPLERAGRELGRAEVQEDGRVHEDRVAGWVDQQLLDQNVLKLAGSVRNSFF